MNAEERFEIWWKSLREYGGTQTRIVSGQPVYKEHARVAWLACEAARDAEIERVVAELEAENCPGRVPAHMIPIRLLKAILSAPRKEGG